MAEHLIEKDPNNASTYKSNLKKAHKALDNLTKKVKSELKKDFNSIVFHDAYQYFEARFGVSPAGALSASDATDPGPARVAALRDLARERGIACVFSEPQFDGARVTAIFGETVRHGVLDPLGSAHAPGPALYPALLGDMATALEECLGGS